VVTNAGGPGILLADTCEGRGLSLPEFAAATTARLKTFLPAQAGLANPVDMIASADAEQYALTIEAVGRDPSIDALIVVHVPTMVSDSMAIGAGIARGVGTLPAEKPAQVVFLSSAGAPASLHAGPRGRLPSYAFPENAALALAAAAHYGKWRERPQGEIFRLDRFAESAVRAVVERVLADADGPRWLAPADVACVLRAAGIELAASESTTPESAVALAERLGFPLVAKLVSPDVLHKSDVGGVVLGLRTPQDVARATDRLVERAKAIGARVDGILLQREVTGGIETLVGVTSDPTFGPLVVCGLGGVLVELLRDVAFRLTPVSDFEAREMIASLRTGRLLDGYRGSPPGDRAALVEIIRRVSALVEIIPELRELDLNPVSVLEPGKGAVALDARIRIAPG
jgi:acyl-CoA synthetase (NDP forming)